MGRKALRGWCVGWIVAGKSRDGPRRHFCVPGRAYETTLSNVGDKECRTQTLPRAEVSPNLPQQLGEQRHRAVAWMKTQDQLPSFEVSLVIPDTQKGLRRK